MGLDCLKKTGNFLNLSYVYSTLANSDGADPFDFEAFCRFPGEVKSVATNALTGQPKYFDRSDYSLDDYSILMASCCLPIACKPVVIETCRILTAAFQTPCLSKRRLPTAATEWCSFLRSRSRSA